MYILATMLVLIGYSANASSIELEHEDGHYHLSEESYSAINSTVGFLFVATGLRFVRLLWYAWSLPKFRISLLSQAVICVLVYAFIIPLYVSNSVAVIITMPAIVFGCEFFGRFLLGIIVIRPGKKAKRLTESGMRIPGEQPLPSVLNLSNIKCLSGVNIGECKSSQLRDLL